jgi:molybdenum cofactor cytidylyltransferase
VKIAAIILAAGRSSRFEDGHKLLVEIGGIPIVRRVCETIAASRVDDVLLIVSETNGPVARAAGIGRWQAVENPNATEGLSTSLRIGLQNIASDTDGVLVALADMPGITAALVDALISTFASNRSTIVFPVASDGRRGHPIIWPKSLLPDLMSVPGDSGGKTILSDHTDLWRPVACENEGAFADIDTRADLAFFRGANLK